jgi:hypothetical protein
MDLSISSSSICFSTTYPHCRISTPPNLPQLLMRPLLIPLLITLGSSSSHTDMEMRCWSALEKADGHIRAVREEVNGWCHAVQKAGVLDSPEVNEVYQTSVDNMEEVMDQIDKINRTPAIDSRLARSQRLYAMKRNFSLLQAIVSKFEHDVWELDHDLAARHHGAFADRYWRMFTQDISDALDACSYEYSIGSTRLRNIQSVGSEKD